MSEQLALQQFARDSRAIDRDKPLSWSRFGIWAGYYSSCDCSWTSQIFRFL